MSAITTAADVVNLSLGRIGYKGRIGSLYDGSTAAKHALDIYGQTRDQLIYDGDWEFCERSVSATLQKQAPDGGYFGIPWTNLYPILPWMFQYGFPSDCVKLRSVLETPDFLPDFDPKYHRFSIYNDNTFNPPKKVVLCNVPNAIFLYAARVTNPAAWNEAFIEAIAASLGRRLAPVLLGLDAAKLAASDEQAEINIAELGKG